MSDVQGTYEERLRQLNLTTLEERRLRGDAIEVYKLLGGFYDIDRNDLFMLNNAIEPKTRQQHSCMPLIVPRTKLDLRQKFFTVRGANYWNSLPSHIRGATSVNSFKNAYDQHLKNNTS